ncbi:chemotaxis protein MotA [Devosia enhydra]|uniref:Chemotaxis protein MotA n=1 Tax=Devosia enhydra TaxID=665118 RepID=A0A1K2I2U4_9HYPH|nr:MotA/TolQ/ExbB proton channel family protein [Devosia enhydra]SFZ86649.1 chemotaxis protein MotA [Devosia enhydra]
MDIATIVGIVGGVGVLLAAILLEGSNPMSFLHVLPAVVVIGGATLAVLVRTTLSGFGTSLWLGVKSALFFKPASPTLLIDAIGELADTMRKRGPIALEEARVEDPFLRRGIRMIADGYTAEAIRVSLERERDLDYERLEGAHKVYKALGDAAPGMGMVGTLIGLVSMFGHMDDPKKIGPGMAIALLATFYGAAISNVIALPIADKLAYRADWEGTTRSMIIDALVMIREGRAPPTIREELSSYLPLHQRGDVLAEAA